MTTSTSPYEKLNSWTQRSMLRSALLITFCLAWFSNSASAQSGNPPDIVFVYSDSLNIDNLFGGSTVSSYTNRGDNFAIGDNFLEGSFPLLSPGFARSSTTSGSAGGNMLMVTNLTRITGNGESVGAVYWLGMGSSVNVEVWTRDVANLAAVIDNNYGGQVTVTSPNTAISGSVSWGGDVPGSGTTNADLVKLICELKQRNPRLGCPRIAQQLAKQGRRI